MPVSRPNDTGILSIMTVALLVVAAGGGFFFPELYRDSAIYGNDLVTLVVAVPLLAIALFFTRRGSLRG